MWPNPEQTQGQMKSKDWIGQPNQQHFADRIDLEVNEPRLRNCQEHTKAALDISIE